MSSELEKQFLALRRQVIEASFGGLNPVQRQAVFAVSGPLLILAGAGSGKTTVLVNRIANLVRFGAAYDSSEIAGQVTEQDLQQMQALLAGGGKPEPGGRLAALLPVGAARPWQVLAITFTNKAAGELKGRLAAMLGEAAREIQASTFHSACVRILRREAEAIGFPKGFTIYDADDSLRAMKEVYKQYQLDEKFLPFKSALSAIGRLKDRMIGPRQAEEQAREMREKLVATAYAGYAKRLAAAGAMDFDDLIYQTVRLFTLHPERLAAYQSRWQYILVDEYQDTSVAQFQLVALLGAGHNNVCVVGDDDQSIYRFRGATIENILSFEEHFPGARVIRLEQNYRSTARILDAANRVIRNNQGRKGKTLWTDNKGGAKLQLYKAETEQDEAAHIAALVGRNLQGGAKLADHAVLYRMNAQSGPLETYFARAGIPYKIIGGHRFFDRKEVKDILSYLSVVVNPQDELRLRRIVNEPARKIGGATLETVAQIAGGVGCSLLEVILQAHRYPALVRAMGPLQNFAAIYRDLAQAAQTQPLDELFATVIDRSGYRAMLEGQGEEGRTRLENLGQLISSAKTYLQDQGEEASLEGYLEEVALISDIDSYDEDADAVVMMTMHAAKGLEFDHVFIVGMEEGVFPGEMSRYQPEDLEEERRLCYVGVTRAKKTLCLSCARTRMMFGQTRRNPPSRFLAEMGEEEMEVEESTAAPAFSNRVSAGTARQRETSRRAESFRSFTRSSLGAGQPVRAAGAPKRGAGVSFAVGDRVEHKVFGRGVVLEVTPIAGDTIVKIEFERAGVKKTMANYAPLTKL